MDNEPSHNTPNGNRNSLSCCPICGKSFERTRATYPFCSERCRLVDLNRWFNGQYQISRPYDPQQDQTT